MFEWIEQWYQSSSLTCEHYRHEAGARDQGLSVSSPRPATNFMLPVNEHSPMYVTTAIACYEQYLSQMTTNGVIAQIEDQLMETIYCRLFIRCGDILRNLNLKKNSSTTTAADMKESRLLKYYVCVRYVFKAFTPPVPALSSDSALTTVWKGYKDCNKFNFCAYK